jgi:cystathionine beta-lyase
MEAGYTQGEPWLAELLAYLQATRDWFALELARDLPLVAMSPLEGTYLLWLDFRRYRLSPDELRRRILDRAQLALNEGAMFGAGGEGFQRMNIGCPRSVVAQALERLTVAFADGRP